MAGRLGTLSAALVLCAFGTAAEARPAPRIVHIHARTVIVYGSPERTPSGVLRIESPRRGQIVFVHRSPIRPTRAAIIACQMGPNFLGAAWRGKRYRPYTRTGRSRICETPV